MFLYCFGCFVYSLCYFVHSLIYCLFYSLFYFIHFLILFICMCKEGISRRDIRMSSFDDQFQESERGFHNETDAPVQAKIEQLAKKL